LRSLSELISKAKELKERGLSTYEIADELKVQADTVVWLLLHGTAQAKGPPPYDVFVDWSPIGSSVKRLSLLGWALADLIQESMARKEMEEPDAVVGIEGAGMVLGVMIAERLEKPFASIKPQRLAEKKVPGPVHTSFASVERRRVLIVDAVMRAGETIKIAIQALQEVRAKPVGIALLANKSGKDSVEGVPLKALVQLLPVTGS